MSAQRQPHPMWTELWPCVRQQSIEELLDESKERGHPVWRAYIDYAADFGVRTRPEFVAMLESANSHVWQQKTEAVFADLCGCGPDFPRAA